MVEYLDRLSSYCKRYDLQISDDQLITCLQHLSLVLEENKNFNLTRITSVDDAIVLHVLDSLLFMPYIESSPSGKVLDMGTGAGFPGVPLAICSDRPFTLLDSVSKKVAAVNRFISDLSLSNASAIHSRIEDYALLVGASYSCIVARALASLPVLLEYASPLLSMHGRLIVSKGTPSSDELSSGLKAASMCGFTFSDSIQLDLPEDLGHRTFIIFEKSSSASISLPRQAGMAKRKPLA